MITCNLSAGFERRKRLLGGRGVDEVRALEDERVIAGLGAALALRAVADVDDQTPAARLLGIGYDRKAWQPLAG